VVVVGVGFEVVFGRAAVGFGQKKKHSPWFVIASGKINEIIADK
jgi:hypothetical protein